MLKIRLKRVGRKHDPSYRIVVTEDFRGPKSGKYLENIGSYDPRKDTKTINADRVKYWISKGAQISDTVHNIFVTEKIIEGKKKDSSSKKVGKKAQELKKKGEEKTESPVVSEPSINTGTVEEAPKE